MMEANESQSAQQRQGQNNNFCNFDQMMMRKKKGEVSHFGATRPRELNNGHQSVIQQPKQGNPSSNVVSQQMPVTPNVSAFNPQNPVNVHRPTNSIGQSMLQKSVIQVNGSQGQGQSTQLRVSHPEPRQA